METYILVAAFEAVKSGDKRVHFRSSKGKWWSVGASTVDEFSRLAGSYPPRL